MRPPVLTDRTKDSLPASRRFTLSGPGEPVEIAFADWPGPDDVPPLLCIPGFTRTGRDFEELAKALAGRRRVICPDLVGRGQSGRLADPSGYTMRTYLAHMSALVSTLQLREVAVIGVSMGGLVAMALASDPAMRVSHLVAVDVGPSVPSTAFDLLDLYLAGNHRFADFDALLGHVKRYFSACDLPSELAWRLFAFRGARKLGDGSYVPDYDPAIRIPFRADFRGMERAWPAYDAIAAPTLVLRGAQSHVLPAEVAAEMTRRGPRATLVTVPGAGHWPALVKPAETALVATFLSDEG
jgi:pimeloyl-ACP methyl ester carboxylesterase